MDDWGCLRPNLEDARSVRLSLRQGSAAVFPLGSLDDVGAMIVFVCTQFEKIGAMPFGGNPVGRAYVGIYGRGCNHFAMEETHAGYFEEKLRISASEAETLAQFWRFLWSTEASGTDSQGRKDG